MSTDTRKTRVRRLREARAWGRIDAPEAYLEEWPDDGGAQLERARVAGELAATRAGEVISDLPAAELADVEIGGTLRDETIAIRADVRAFARTDPEGRAVAAVEFAALAIVEHAPHPGDAFSIGGIEVAGGEEPCGRLSLDPPAEVGVVVVSDAVASGEKDDTAGAVVRNAVDALEDTQVRRVASETVPDDIERIRNVVRRLAEDGLDLVLTVGGTGVTHTDRTIEAIEPLFDVEIPGVMEAARRYGLERTPFAMMSRGTAGFVAETLVATFPGSTSGARETCEALLPDVLYLVRTRRKSRQHLAPE